MDIAAVERSYGELLAALGDLVVARHRDEPRRGTPAELLEPFLGRPLIVEPLLADLRRGS